MKSAVHYLVRTPLRPAAALNPTRPGAGKSFVACALAQKAAAMVTRHFTLVPKRYSEISRWRAAMVACALPLLVSTSEPVDVGNVAV
jgi:hypothetical protein